MATININETSYYYELHGDGPTLVLISGYSCDCRLWMSVLDDLSKHYQVLIFDNRGVGRTHDNGNKLTAELMADDTMELIKALNLHKPHILGSSMAGTIAQYIGSKYSNDIGKLILLCTTLKWRQAALQGLGYLIKLREQDVDPKTLISGILPWALGEKTLCNIQFINQFIELTLADQYPQSITDIKRQFEVLVNFNGKNINKLITAPTLIIHGAEDIISLPYESEILAQEISNSILVQLPCGHAPMIEFRSN